ncbi:MAG: hypothetical protein RMY29_029255 [Nostoc sp. CreGUA01]|nr:hypothetical protein [Nostoc sp. CreGUA01]
MGRGHGDTGTRRRGDAETRGHGDAETRGHGDTLKEEDSATSERLIAICLPHLPHLPHLPMPHAPCPYPITTFPKT